MQTTPEAVLELVKLALLFPRIAQSEGLPFVARRWADFPETIALAERLDTLVEEPAAAPITSAPVRSDGERIARGAQALRAALTRRSAA